MSEDVPDYIRNFFNNQKESLDKIYAENYQEHGIGILNIFMDKEQNKVDVFYLNEEKIKENYGDEYLKTLSIDGDKIFQVCDKELGTFVMRLNH